MFLVFSNSPNRMVIWDDNLNKIILEIGFKESFMQILKFKVTKTKYDDY
jgi:hypothetical protein